MKKNSPIRVVVVDDHEMILQSVVRLLSADPKIEVVGTALTAVDGIEIVKRELPDVLVIDFHLPDMDAPDAIKIIREATPKVGIVTFSGSERAGALYASIRAGSSAWIRKTRAIQELRKAIVQVAAGEIVPNEEMDSLPKLKDLVVLYQPIVELSDGKTIGFEAMVRWNHPEKGLLGRDSFLPQAEETGFIIEIDQAVRAQAISQLERWQRRPRRARGLWLSIDKSADDLTDPELYGTVHKRVTEGADKPKSYVGEITDSIVLDDSDKTVEFMSRLNAVGIFNTLDDIEDIDTALSSTREYPFDQLKIDSTFFKDVPSSMRVVWLIEGISQVARTMKMICIAVGIERQDQLDALREAGVHYGQGDLFAPPQIARECDALLSKSSLLPAAESSVENIDSHRFVR